MCFPYPEWVRVMPRRIINLPVNVAFNKIERVAEPRVSGLPQNKMTLHTYLYFLSKSGHFRAKMTS